MISLEEIKALIVKYGGNGDSYETIPKENLEEYKNAIADLMTSESGPPGPPKECSLCNILSECSIPHKMALLSSSFNAMISRELELVLCIECSRLQWIDAPKFFNLINEKFRT